MFKNHTFAYFAPSTDKGRELFRIISEATTEIHFDLFESKKCRQIDFLLAVHKYDIVIVDCSLPDFFSKKSKSVYPILTAQINCLNHIITISETQLPLNVTPYRGIYPKGINETFTPEQIAERIRDVITDSIMEDRYERLRSINFKSLLTDFQSIRKMIEDSLEVRSQKTVGKTKVMISYRSHYYKDYIVPFMKKINGDSNEAAMFRSKLGLNGNYAVEAFEPDSLCLEDEANTPMRKWMMIGQIDDKIREIDEVWVYDTQDYATSWWTIAEMVILQYVNRDRNGHVKLRVYNPDKETFIDKPCYVAELKDDDCKRIARILSNTRSDSMGPEQIEQIKKLKIISELSRTPIGSKWINKRLQRIKPMLEKYISSITDDPEEKEEIFNEMIKIYSSPDEMDNYANDEVFSDDFWNSISQQQGCTPAFELDAINVKKFLDAPMNEILGYSELEFLQLADSGKTITIGNEKKIVTRHYNNSTQPANRYLWHATRMGKTKFKDAPGLEVNPVFFLK